MIIDSFVELDQSKFPVVIFGSGPAGLSLALELEKKNINCLLIEAGDEYFSEESQSYYKINTDGTNLLHVLRFRPINVYHYLEFLRPRYTLWEPKV